MSTSAMPLDSSPDAAKSRVATLLRQRILQGSLRFGESLPSERQLSEQLGVGRTVVRQALAELDSQGMLERAGSRVRKVAFDRGDDHPAWLKRSVAIITPRRLTGGSTATRTRWLQYTTLGTIDHLRERDIHGITLSLGAIDNAELQRFANSKPLGVLVPELTSIDDDISSLADVFANAGVPVVCYGGSPVPDRFDRVISDHETGSYELTQAVLARGCKSLVRFWPKPYETYWFEARTRGMGRMMDEAGLSMHDIAEFPYTPAPIEDKAAFDYIVKQIAGFLLEPLRQHKPDALLMATDRDVPYAAAALRLHGLTPGKDILIAGYDNYWQHCEERAFEPDAPTFTIDKRNQRAGSEMVQLLFDRVESRLPAERQVRVLKQNLIEFTSASMVDSRVV